MCPNCAAVISKERKKGLWLQDTETLEVSDSTGTALLDVWGKDVGLYKKGDKLHLYNGYCKVVEGITYLKAGKYGKLVRE